MSYLQYIVKRYKAKQIIFLLRNRKKPKHLFGTALLTKKIHCLKKIRIWHLGLPPPSTLCLDVSQYGLQGRKVCRTC